MFVMLVTVQAIWKPPEDKADKDPVLMELTFHGG